jgi:hypothetical protein
MRLRRTGFDRGQRADARAAMITGGATSAHMPRAIDHGRGQQDSLEEKSYRV